MPFVVLTAIAHYPFTLPTPNFSPCLTMAFGFGTQPFSVKIHVGDRHTGHIGRQASGIVTVTDGETIFYTTVCLFDVPSEPSDFFPLYVNYQECFSAAGQTSGGFFKREARTKDHDVLICRLNDRPLHPTILKGFYNETQILSWVLSYDGLHSPDSLAITAAGIATIAGVRIGLVGDKFIVNPTTKEMEDSELDLLLVGTDSAILMIEGYCEFLSEEKLLQAVKVGQDVVRAICNEVDALVKRFGKPKMFDVVKLPPYDLYISMSRYAIIGDELVQVLQIKTKIPRRKALSFLEEKVLTILIKEGYVSTDPTCRVTETIADLVEDEDEDEEVVVDGELFSEVDVKLVFKEVTSKYLRRCIVENGRSDGQTLEDIRLINSRCGLLPRAHGSALFTRGETQLGCLSVRFNVAKLCAHDVPAFELTLRIMCNVPRICAMLRSLAHSEDGLFNTLGSILEHVLPVNLYVSYGVKIYLLKYVKIRRKHTLGMLPPPPRFIITDFRFKMCAGNTLHGFRKEEENVLLGNLFDMLGVSFSVPKMAKANWLEEIEKKKINNNNLKCLDNIIKLFYYLESVRKMGLFYVLNLGLCMLWFGKYFVRFSVSLTEKSFRNIRGRGSKRSKKLEAYGGDPNK
ncbi:hypothetical protein UlMin_033115 [Ulmus minor]